MNIELNKLEALRQCKYAYNERLQAYVSDNLYMSVVATNACQCKCPYCINSLTDRTLSLPIDKAKENIKRAVEEFGVQEAVILGGEPTLYPHLLELIAALKEAGLRYFGLTTNGIKLKDHDFLEALVKSDIDFLNVSIHNNGEFLTKAEMRSVYIDFVDMRCHGQKLRINTNVWRGNHDNPTDLLNWIEKMSYCCDEMRVSNIIRKDGFSVNADAVKEAEDMYMRDEEYDRLFDEVMLCYQKAGYSIIHNPAALGFVNYYLIPTRTPIIINWNIDSRVSDQVCENDVGNRHINTIKLLVNGDLSLSWNTSNRI